MPPFVESVLAVLADPHFLSLVALVVAVWSLIRTGPLTAIQTKLAALELKDRERIEASRTQADIGATLYEWGQHSHRIAIENGGGAPAFGVDIEVLDEKGSGLFPQGVREEHLPIPKLDPGASVPLLVALASGRWPPFDIALTWKDPDGTPHRKETKLYGP